ncbi:MAG: YceD family protein [Agarilytica sp.]
MSEGSPSQRLPKSLNPRKFAYQGLSFQGPIDGSALTRLAGAVDSIGDTSASLVFSISEDGKMVLEGKIDSLLSYQCQRCMESMAPEAVSIDFKVAIVRNEDEAKSLPKSLDPWLVEEDEANVYYLIEDELLLSLPVVANHAHACIEASLMQSGEAVEQEPETDKTNPFSVLAELKGDKPAS